MSGQCQALYSSDERRCQAAATCKHGLFCQYHARQCYGLYKGYKRRNAQLDHLIANPPALLQNTALHELDVAAIKDEQVLDQIREHLQRRYALLDRVIRARRLHHSQFYALELDYGHEQYLNQLLSQKTPVLRALESVNKRLAEVLYEKQIWFTWIRRLEEEETKDRDAEKKKIKQEAALFKRHSREVEARLLFTKAQEDEKAQSDYLDKIWEERQKEDELDENNVEDMWDPVEDSIEDERGNYLNLLRYFLWQETMADKVASDVTEVKQDKTAVSDSQKETVGASKSKNAKKRARQKTNVETKPKEQADQAYIESPKEIRERLGIVRPYQTQMYGTKDGKALTLEHFYDRPPIVTAEEIEQVLLEIAEIKQLLFCRILLSHTTLLSTALHANSVDEFLADDRVSNVDLRDLCLKMERPGLQLLRDACADLRREDDLGEDQVTVEQESQTKSISFLKEKIPRLFETKREKSLKAKREEFLPTDGAIIDFGDIHEETNKKVKIRVCGRNIWNYPSEKEMSRGGWFQFSVIAKDCRLEDAVRLCRNWDEFSELVFLARNNYFPANGWISFTGDRENQQLFKLGFFPTFRMDRADTYSQYHQSSRNEHQRTHQIFEMRNWVCGQMKRNDAVTRRFLQYLAMSTTRLVLFVRDVATGRVLVKPPEDQLWLVRCKVGTGRASKNEFNDIRSVGPNFIEEMEAHRQWNLDFREYYEIVVWDSTPKQPFSYLYNTIQACLFKAHRLKTGIEFWQPYEHIMKTITIDTEHHRVRDIKPGEVVTSMWDRITAEPSLKVLNEGESAELPAEWIYNEVDALEDEVLFSWDHSGTGTLLDFQKGAMHRLESSAPNIGRFALDLDTDDEVSETEINEEVQRLSEMRNARRVEVDHDENEDDDDEPDLLHDDSETDDSEDSSQSDDPDDRLLSEEETEAAREMIVAIEQWHDYDASQGEILDLDASVSARQMARMRRQERETQRQLEMDAMEEDFELFIDRERATVFKDSWHRADLESGAQGRWRDYLGLTKNLMSGLQWPNSQAFDLRSMAQTYRLLHTLQIDDSCHRRVVKDARFACIFVPLFFGVTTPLGEDEELKKLLIFDQVERAQNPPQRRSAISCRMRPGADFKEWDKQKLLPQYPAEWDKTIRPIIAHLYRAGVVCSSYLERVAGPAVCLTEPGQPPDLFFDWRSMVKHLSATSSLADPHRVTPLIDQATAYAKHNSQARFSVLKIWSAPHFWPLMIGFDRREHTSFVDGVGRHWEWKFIPKDMPSSEWSVHKVVGDRLNYDLLKDRDRGKVAHRMDTVLVCAKDESSCELLTKASFFAINTRPWRLEVDPWKSWFNVDIKFLQGLDKKWWG